MPTHFITSNPGKFKEAQAIIPKLQRLDLDLPEIQEIDSKKIIKHKLLTAQKLLAQETQNQPTESGDTKSGGIVVGDTSLSLSALDGLPGPLIKWFLKTIGVEGLAEIARQKQDNRAVAKVMLGYADAQGGIHFFEGRISGQIVEPRGDNGFGWDKIFQPNGRDKTFAEMSLAEKNKISMRKQAFEKLKKYLDQH